MISTISKIVFEIQQKYGYTLSEIAKKIKVSEAVISRWKSGKNIPSSKNTIKLKRLLDVGAEIEETNKQSSQDNATITNLTSAIINLTTNFQNLALTLPGRMDQLTKQIEMLQAENGKLQHLLQEQKQSNLLTEIDYKKKLAILAEKTGVKI